MHFCIDGTEDLAKTDPQVDECGVPFLNLYTIPSASAHAK